MIKNKFMIHKIFLKHSLTWMEKTRCCCFVHLHSAWCLCTNIVWTAACFFWM